MVSIITNALRPLPTLPRSSSGSSINKLKSGNRSPSSPSGFTSPTPALSIASAPSTIDMESLRSDSLTEVDAAEIRKVMILSPLAVESGSGMFGMGLGKGMSSASSTHHSTGPPDTIFEETVDSNGMMVVSEAEVEIGGEREMVVEQVDTSGSCDHQAEEETKKQHASNGHLKLSPPPSSWNEKPPFSTLGRTSSTTSLTGGDGTSVLTKVGSERGETSVNGSVVSLISGIEHTPTAWGANFWVVLSDPLTQSTFYACPSTGDCSWDPPVGAMVLPRKPEGEWWELSDQKRGGRSYFYQTVTGETQWTRPTDDLVIPLGMIQINALGERPAGSGHTSAAFSAAKKRQERLDLHSAKGRKEAWGKDVKRADGAYPRHRHGSAVSAYSALGRPIAVTGKTRLLEGTTTPFLPYEAYSAPQESPPPLPSKDLPVQGRGQVAVPKEIAWGAAMGRSPNNKGSGMSMSSSSALASPHRGSAAVESPRRHARNRSIEEPGSNGTGSESSLKTPPAFKRPFSRSGRESKPMSGSADLNRSPSPPPSARGGLLARLRPRGKRSMPAAVMSQAHSMGNLPGMASDAELEPPPSIFTVKKSASASELRVGPNLRIEDGPIQVELPVETKKTQHRPTISAPLLQTSRYLPKESVRSFKVIQHVMGDRDKPVDGITAVQTSASARNIVALAEEEMAADKTRLWNKTERRWLLEEERWLLQLGITRPEMRDEIYSQCMKQLTNNPDCRSIFQGFQLLCVLVVTFGPSKDLECIVRSFLRRNLNDEETGITTMATYCIGKLDTIMAKGPRSRALMFGEIEQASNAAFTASIFGESLGGIMRFQQSTHPKAPVPYILSFLAEAIIALGGLTCEGIFRVPGDSDSVSETKAKLDRGHYQLTGINEPHVTASLLKLWLRELPEPLVPNDMYNTALDCSRDEVRSCAFLAELPMYNRRVLLYLIDFLQLFIVDSVIADTKMTASNLALVFAPNILRTTAANANVVYTNSTYEARFILNLLRTLNPKEADPEYQPAPPAIPRPIVRPTSYL